AGLLTYLAVRQDKGDPNYQLAVREAHESADRVKALAAAGIPPEGALALLRMDPLTQGPKIFARNCASCHRYDKHDGLGNPVADAPTASDLKGFGSREWLTRFISPEHIADPEFFGGTKFKDGKMARFVKKDVA